MFLQEVLFIVFIVTMLVTLVYGAMIYSKTANTYHPMIIFVWTFFLLQVLESVFRGNAVIWNFIRQFGPLAEIGLVLWQARRLQVIKKRWGFFGIMFALVGVGAIVEFSLSPGSGLGTSWSSIAASFLITLLAIEMLNNALINQRGSLSTNAVFLFAIALIFFYTFNGLLEVFLMIGAYTGAVAENNIFYLYALLAIVTNLLFFKSFLCIPRKGLYSMS